MNPRFAWGHININVKDLDASMAFYQTLGFSVFLPGIPYLKLSVGERAEVPQELCQAMGWPAQTNGRACIMQIDDGFPKIDLTELTDLEQREPLGNAHRGLVRICLTSQDLQQDYEYLVGKGVTFLNSPKPCAHRLADVATCVDPDGTLIELLQVYLERWAPYLE